MDKSKSSVLCPGSEGREKGGAGCFGPTLTELCPYIKKIQPPIGKNCTNGKFLLSISQAIV